MILKTLVTILIGYIFYYRGNISISYFSFNFSKILPLIIISILGLLLLKMKKDFIPDGKPFIILFLILMVYFNLQVLFNEDMYIYIYKFFLEIYLSILVLLIIIAMIKIYKIDFILKSIFFSSLPIALYMLVLAVNLNNIRRIGAGDVPLPVAVNHLGHSLAIALIIGLYYICIEKKVFKKFVFIVSTFCVATATFLTGSKAALLGVFLSLIFYIVIKIKKIKIIHLFFIVTSIISIYLIFLEKINRLLYRFSFERFIKGFEERKTTWLNAINDFDISYLFIGQPYKYELINNYNFISYPHNLFLICPY